MKISNSSEPLLKYKHPQTEDISSHHKDNGPTALFNPLTLLTYSKSSIQFYKG